MVQDEAAYREARRHVKNLRHFYWHLVVYIIVNAMLVIINLIVSPHTLWFYWITIFWGIGVVMNAVQVFSHDKVLGKDWEERKIQEYINSHRDDNVHEEEESD